MAGLLRVTGDSIWTGYTKRRENNSGKSFKAKYFQKMTKIMGGKFGD
jgi:hypothetical protein